jgi:hypothetical protein
MVCVDVMLDERESNDRGDQHEDGQAGVDFTNQFRP